jgi:hypothetical protein
MKRCTFFAACLLTGLSWALAPQTQEPVQAAHPALVEQATKCLVAWAVQGLPMPEYNAFFYKSQTKDFEDPHTYLIYCPYLPKSFKLIDDPRVRRLREPPKSLEVRDGVVVLDIELLSANSYVVVLSLTSLSESNYGEYRFMQKDGQMVVAAGRK